MIIGPRLPLDLKFGPIQACGFDSPNSGSRLFQVRAVANYDRCPSDSCQLAAARKSAGSVESRMGARCLGRNGKAVR